jgi:hypothetical protein
VRLFNALSDMQVLDFGFEVVESATGRLKRIRNYTGTVDNPMDLRSFPFGMDKIELEFFTVSHWSTYDGQRSGQMAKGKSYRLRQIRKPGEGDWLDLRWSGVVAEWRLHGCSTQIKEQSAYAQGQQKPIAPLSVHVTRNSAYYFWKALLPLYLLTVLSMSAFHFETDNLAARVSTVSTYFLAAFAMLYVVEAALPKNDFLTKIDTVIVMTTVSLAFSGLASVGIAQLHEDAGADVAANWDLGIKISLFTLYVLYHGARFLTHPRNKKCFFPRRDS